MNDYKMGPFTVPATQAWPADPYVSKVAEFHKAFGVETPRAPEFPERVLDERNHDKAMKSAREVVSCQREVALTARNLSKQYGGNDLLLSRFQLMSEELHEVMEAMCRQDPNQTAAEISDLLYVVFGTANALGLGSYVMPVFTEVHKANMSKINPDTGRPFYDDSGKITKGPYYRKPNIRGVMNETRESVKLALPAPGRAAD